MPSMKDDDVPGPEAADGSAPGGRDPTARPLTATDQTEVTDLPSPGTESTITEEGVVREQGQQQTLDVEHAAAARRNSGPVYSSFSRRTNIWITAMVTVGSFVSPMTAHIYFPALNPIASDLKVSTSLINLTLTTYIVVQGISPMLFGDLGDMAGRRPAYIIAFVIYFLPTSDWPCSETTPPCSCCAVCSPAAAVARLPWATQSLLTFPPVPSEASTWASWEPV